MPRHIEQPALRHSDAGGAEDPVEALGLGLRLDLRRARDHQDAHAVLDRAAVEHRGGDPQVLDPAVGAGADEDGVDGDVLDRRARGEVHVGERSPAATPASSGSAKPSGSGTRPVIGTDCAGVVPQVTVGSSEAASMTTVRS